MIPAQINPYGVLSPCEKKILAQGRDYHAIAKVAQHPESGTWAAGLDAAAGSMQVDSFRQLLPTLAKNATHPTRAAAIEAARDAAVKTFKRHIRWDGLNTIIRRACDQALAELESARQGELF